MKKTIVRIVLVTLFLAASSAAPVLAGADTTPAPMCWPNPCASQ